MGDTTPRQDEGRLGAASAADVCDNRSVLTERTQCSGSNGGRFTAVVSDSEYSMDANVLNNGCVNDGYVEDDDDFSSVNGWYGTTNVKSDDNCTPADDLEMAYDANVCDEDTLSVNSSETTRTVNTSCDHDPADGSVHDNEQLKNDIHSHDQLNDQLGYDHNQSDYNGNNNNRYKVSFSGDASHVASTEDSAIANGSGNHHSIQNNKTVSPIDDDNRAKKVRAPKLKTKTFSFPPWKRTKSSNTDHNGNPVIHGSNGPIMDTLPEPHHKSILHNSDDPNPDSPKKKLTFQLPLSKNKQGKPTTNGSAPTTNSSVRKKLARRFTFPTSLSKLAHRHAQGPREHRGTASTVVTADTLASDRTDKQKDRRSTSSKENEGEEGEEDHGCGNCKCYVPLPTRLKNWLNRDTSIEGKEIRNTLAIGVAFQLVFTAHFAIQNLQSSLHEEEYLGVSALGCLYASSIFSSIFAPTIIGVLGTKGSLVLAWLSHILYTLAQFHPAWETLVPASILLGVLTGPTWTAQGLYVSACAYSFSKRSPHSPYTILSRFNGLFFTLYETRQILGNLLSSVVLRDGVGNKSEEVIFKFCGPRDCPYLENVTDIEEPDKWVISSVLGIYITLQVIGLALTVFLVTPLSRSEWSARAPVRQTATSWFRTLVGTKMLFLVPLMVFQAMEQGILLSEYTKSYISCPIGIHMVGFVMATHGATSAVFVFIFSRLARHTGRFPLFAIAAGISLVLLVVLFDWTPNSEQETLIFILPVLWGIGEGIWQTQTNSMIAVMFWNRKEPAFANYQTWRAVGYTFIFSFHSLLCVSTKIAIALGFLVVGMVLYTAVEIHIRWKERIRIPETDSSETSPAGSTPPESASGKENENSSSSSSAPDFEVDIASPSDVETPKELRSVASFSSFKVEDSDTEHGDRVTLDGTYLSKGESAYLDNDLRRYGVMPVSGSRPLTMASMPKSASEGDDERWAQKELDDYWNSGSSRLSNQQPARPHSWHEHHFQDEGELKVVWTKDDVFVY